MPSYPGPARVVLDFAEGTVTLAAAERARIGAGLGGMGLQPEARLLICAYGSTTASSRRTAYLRALTVRAALIDLGWPAGYVTLRIAVSADSAVVSIAAQSPGMDCSA
ncbi:MAG: hypothetical protein REI09_15475 [Candidatus Dactylopiibacterium sp.]|nr:hypothetical protein [Candidatus Dactylopiibacterium sp.]